MNTDQRAASPKTAKIELRQVGKQWGDVVTLQPSSIAIPEASFTVLLGPSGCGKTTTLRLIAGLDVASRGQILIDGHDVTVAPPSKRGVAMVFQNYALFPHLSVADNIVFGLQVRGASRQEQAERLTRVLSLLSLEKLRDRKPSQLSGGQQQRVALARALVADSGICLMDEPLSNLDAQLRQEMRQELRALQQKLGLTVVYVTHDQTEAMSMADQVVLLNHGRIEQIGTPREIYAKPASVFAARFIGTPPMSIISLAGSAISGSTQTVSAPEAAVSIGLRPEEVALDGDVAATVRESEYLGADCLLRCRIGDQEIAVRAPGQNRFDAGQEVRLGWPVSAVHAFDAQGLRLP
ncbi:ABC transporter ATP-binding protein [Casimicrobium huifangae]|uniref:ABC transporter ATP-binding protein n=1 Tax=Casimicrobium huifangae TaxID=2591109 RepID=UPI003783E6C9